MSRILKKIQLIEYHLIIVNYSIVRKMKSIATKDKNKPRRIYYDHFFRNNIAAVEQYLKEIDIDD